jgi:hypothetical protein
MCLELLKRRLRLQPRLPTLGSSTASTISDEEMVSFLPLHANILPDYRFTQSQ